MIQITNATDTRILDITVTSPDPRQAADIANELVEQACIYLPQIMETDEPNLVESAIPPTEKIQPQHCPQCGTGRDAGSDPLLRRAAGAVSHERYLRHPGRYRKVFWRAASGHHP